MNETSLKGKSLEELNNLKDQQTAQLALNIANSKIQADNLVRQNAQITNNIEVINNAITALNAPQA